MTCPACSQTVPRGQGRCPACGAIVAPPVEGSLAADPLASTPPAGRVEPLREIPGLRKRERTWKDEVRERVRDRRHRKASGGELPLFPDTDDAPELAAPPEDPPAPPSERGEFAAEEAPAAVVPPDEPLDLPLRPMDEMARGATALPPETEPERLPAEDAGPEPWILEGRPAPKEVRPVERPAGLFERVQAAAMDLGLLIGLWGIVVYFASRAAHVNLVGLRPAWPYLAAYLAFLGLVYAGYFTGTTGQTVGKIASGLRVVDSGGRPPGYARACLRAGLGVAGILLAFAGLVPMFLDPARRALHDRLLKTRVVKF